jgi:hypothetical protein
MDELNTILLTSLLLLLLQLVRWLGHATVTRPTRVTRQVCTESTVHASTYEYEFLCVLILMNTGIVQDEG